MRTLSAATRKNGDLRLSRVCWTLAATFALLSLAILLFIPQISILSQMDGSRFVYVNRQVDLPTGDAAVFSDYSLLPLCAAIATVAVIYSVFGASLRARHASLFVARHV
jgi:hypothetical protein